MSGLTIVLSIKLMDVLYVSRAWHWFSILCSQADASISTYLGYPKGTFPAGGKLVHALLVKDPSKYQIIYLEFSSSHEPLMVALERQPVACILIADCHICSSTRSISSCRSWYCMASSYVLTHREPMVTSGGRMASAPYIIKKDVSPVVRLDDVRLPYNAHGRSSIHFLSCFFRTL
jgi:hypothetical protein